MAIITPEEYEQRRAELMAYERAQADARAAEEAAKLLPLRQFTNSPAYQEVAAAIGAIKATYRDDNRFAPFIDNLVLGLPALADRAGPLPTSAPEAPEGDDEPAE